MGIISDIREAIHEKHIFFVGHASYQDLDDEPLVIRNTPCSLCQEVFTSEDDLREHVLSAHRDLQVYVRVNNRVISGSHYFDEPIYSCRVVFTGHGEVRILATVNGDSLPEFCLHQSDEIEILGDSRQATTNIALSFSIGNLKPTSVQAYYRPVEHADFGEAEAIALQYQQSITSLTHRDWQRFSHDVRRFSRDYQHVYLEGLFEYYYGYWLEHEGHRADAEVAYLQSSRLLRSINRPLAQTATRYLAFKLNWVRYLRTAPSQSFFRHVYNYFVDHTYRVNIGEYSLKGDTGLLVDDHNEGYLMAINEYVRGRHDLAWSIAQRNVFETSDPCLKLKVLLLEARVHRQSNPVLSRRSYSELLFHPQFEKEAEDYLNAKHSI